MELVNKFKFINKKLIIILGLYLQVFLKKLKIKKSLVSRLLKKDL